MVGKWHEERGRVWFEGNSLVRKGLERKCGRNKGRARIGRNRRSRRRCRGRRSIPLSMHPHLQPLLPSARQPSEAASNKSRTKRSN